jgi:nickel-type superoxide dismutase maturation protease
MLPCRLTLPRLRSARTSRSLVTRIATGMVVIAPLLLAASRLVRRFEVTGPSMEPALVPGDRLVVIALPPRLQPWPKRGDVVAVQDPTMKGRILIKRVTEVDQLHGTLEIVGDHRSASTDSRSFGPVSRSSLVGQAVYRYAPAGRSGRGPWPEAP